MSKAFFRFLRGEINGFYLTNIHNVLNTLTEEDKTFLAHFNNMVFKNPEELKGEEYPIGSEMIKGIGTIAGVFRPRVTSDSFSGTLRMTTSKVVDGVERSERGLFNMEEESFDFVRTNQDVYNTDINTEADNGHRTSMNSNTDEVKGYLASGETNIKEDGSVDLDKVLVSPPANKAYSEFYGVDHLYLSESENVYAHISPPVLLNLIKALQWIRYNGASIESLCRVTEILCPDFVKIDSIDWTNVIYSIVTYTVDSTAIVDNKQMKIEALKFLLRMKFPQMILVEQE